MLPANLIPLLKPLLNLLGKVLGGVFIYKSAKDNEKLKAAKQRLKDEERKDKIEKANARTSTADLLKRVRDQYTRK
jgi:hypothetical protein